MLLYTKNDIDEYVSYHYRIISYRYTCHTLSLSYLFAITIIVIVITISYSATHITSQLMMIIIIVVMMNISHYIMHTALQLTLSSLNVTAVASGRHRANDSNSLFSKSRRFRALIPKSYSLRE